MNTDTAIIGPVVEASLKALARWTDQHVDVIRAARADYDQRTHTTA